MIEITIHGKSPTTIMDIVREMREQGYQQGKDFDFFYHPPGYNGDSWAPFTPKHTVFNFYNEKLATLFSLKWS